jgi:hypothetical protein
MSPAVLQTKRPSGNLTAPVRQGMVGSKDSQTVRGGEMEKEHLEIILEDIKEKFDLVLDGHQSLRHDIKDLRQDMNERFELVDSKIDVLNNRIDGVHDKLDARIDSVERKLSNKIDGVAADLAAHRADTESHPKGYKVSEGKR